ncbi:MAG: DUF4922 domain-containing protein [Bacteroidales bacterium]|nr:DUF4922 domain-containing protein [Bacteroidales bacterium]
MEKDGREIKLEKFFTDQLSLWPMVSRNFRALKKAPVKTITCGGLPIRVQLNPARKISTTAAMDEKSIAARPCFLCPRGRFPEQTAIDFEGRKGKKYDIVLNPYPILPGHLVVPLKEHLPQSIGHRFVDILDLGEKFSGHTFMYNGPHSGASAPDHHHFQAVPKGYFPLENDVRSCLDAPEAVQESPRLEYLSSIQDAKVYHYNAFTRGIFVIEGRTSKSTAKMFYRLLDCAPHLPLESEPRFNMIAFADGGLYRAIVIFRTETRSHHYFLPETDPDRTVVSPGCADMCGYFITIRQKDFDRMDTGLVESVMDEVTLSPEDERKVICRLTRTQPRIQVPLISGSSISFEILSDGAGVRKALLSEGKILYDGALYDELYFEEKTLSTMFAEPSFALLAPKEDGGRTVRRRYAGTLRIIAEGGLITAVNIIGEEDYILSSLQSGPARTKASGERELRSEAVKLRTLLRRDPSSLCEYKGIPRAVNPMAVDAVDATWGVTEGDF